AARWAAGRASARREGELRQADRARLAGRPLGQDRHTARAARRDRRADRRPLPRTAGAPHVLTLLETPGRPRVHDLLANARLPCAAKPCARREAVHSVYG